ncbi:MAG TPA: replication-associated recombination protein A [Candidatus Baltobacteraceae bacterium]|jgi:putative ATPase|nr:replication-associated recombination protein A [Candidatus Baltobacteraceae bacterium]
MKSGRDVEPGLFSGNAPEPLAARMRPRTLDEFVGQAHLVGEGRALRRAIERDAVPSMILWGPPGTGKTTLADIIARTARARFVPLSAVSAGVADLRAVVADAKSARVIGNRTLLFIDEIHRFNKTQQDAILPYVEDGTITFIGATTENPSFEVNPALLSRARVFVLYALSDEEITSLVQRALDDRERGLGGRGIEIDAPARDAIVRLSGGDARVALATLEYAAEIVEPDAHGVHRIDEAIVADAMQRRAIAYDKSGDGHYDVVSAFIKSIRGSDPDAALYWLARMIDAGEDPLFIARRLVIAASEDIGMANSGALGVAVAAQQALHFVGMPEGHYPLAHATIYLATAEKSNDVKTAYEAAMHDVETTRNEPAPLHLRNAPTALMRNLGFGKDYKYAHDDYARDAPHVQEYRPANVAKNRYYKPRSK